MLPGPTPRYDFPALIPLLQALPPNFPKSPPPQGWSSGLHRYLEGVAGYLKKPLRDEFFSRYAILGLCGIDIW